jgi:hypothetical protein
VAYYDNPGQVNDEAISVAGGKTFQVIQVADSSGNIIDPAGGQIVIEGDVIVTEVEISNDVGHPIPVNDAGGSLTVDGPLTDTELRATAVPVSAAALPLPTGAATEAKQDTGNTSLGNIDTDLGAPADAAASSDTGTFGLIALIKRGLQNWTTLLGRVPANLTVTSTRLLVDGSGVTQPVSGPLTDTQLRATAVPVSGTINTLTGLDIPKHDNIALTYTGENLTAVAYKLGATTVATLTLAYTGSRLDSVTKS